MNGAVLDGPDAVPDTVPDVAADAGPGSDAGPRAARGPLAGLRVLVPRSADRAGPLLDALRAAGADPVAAPLVTIERPIDPAPLDAAAATLAAPTTPPAGPDRIVRTASRLASAAVKNPPFDCITETGYGECSSRYPKYLSINGPTYAFTTVVDARSYSRNSGYTACDTEQYTASPNARTTASSCDALA